MDNPLKIIWLMASARRPSRVGRMKAVKEGFWLGRNYAAAMFFGRILTHTQEEADRINADGGGSLERHETIHLLQARSTCDSWVVYYLLYIWYYLRALPQNRYMRNAAYLLNPFEMEAYEHMYDDSYPERCSKGANGWRRYAKMKPKERRRISNS